MGATLHALRRAAAALLVVCSLLACGGGSGDAPAGDGPLISAFSADRAQYFVGERARLTVAYRGGTGRIEPGIGAVPSGATVETPVLDRSVAFTLVVEGGGRSASATRALPVSYRDRYVELAAPFIVSEHAAVTAGDGAVLVFGGSRGQSTLSEAIDRFDPATRLFTRIGSLRTGRSGHTATRLADGRILVFGGATSLSIGNVADLVEERTGAVSHGGALAEPRAWHAATLLADGRVLASGGIGRDTVEIWDPQTNAWRLVAARMAHVRARHTATLLADGRVLLAGGMASGAAYRFAEVFDPGSETFAPVDGAPDEVRQLHAAHRLSDGSVLFVGGEGVAPYASTLRYDAATGRIVAAAPLARARTVVQSVLLPGDRVLLFGGESAINAPTPSGESYVPEQGGAPLAPMPAERVWHSATRLPDGRVLVVGGHDANGAYVPQVLLYE